jgi:heparinase II/III-like protein
MHSGMFRLQLPATQWDDQPLSGFLRDPRLAQPRQYYDHRGNSAPKFFFDPHAMAGYRPLFSQWDTANDTAVAQADELSQGFARFFSHDKVPVGLPPNWHRNPIANIELPSQPHWSQIGDFAAGDIKLVWEVNRFGFVFALVRAYWRTGDECYADLFWQLVESWRHSNAPERGVNWKCGQEVSLRVMAWCFGLYGLWAASATTPERVAMLAQMIIVSGHRIEANLTYALSQQNNHGISEAMGLWTIGILFPECTDAARWAALGRKLLERQAKTLIYDDGAFSEHSLNYQRVMLHDYLWSIRLGELVGTPLSDVLRDRIARAGEFVYQLQDGTSGRVPCYGQDDGALILPLSHCEYGDYRPVVQSIHFLTTGRRRLNAGPWDEDLLWLFGPQSLSSEVDSAPRHDIVATDGGYYTLRSPNGFAFTRATRFRHRPAQADLLHVDLWWRGQNIALDPGTFSYNAPAPWNNPFAHTRYHNTVAVDDKDQMERAGRFLWLPWATGRSHGRHVSPNGELACWQGDHDGYQQLRDPVCHRRGLVRIGDDHWLVIDALHGRETHAFRLHWLLLDAAYEVDEAQQTIDLQTAAGSYRVATAASTDSPQWAVCRAAPDRPEGWRSSFYSSRQPAVSVSSQVEAQQIVFATAFGSQVQQPVIRDGRVLVAGGDWNIEVSLNPFAGGAGPLISSIVSSGTLTDAIHFHRF